MNSRKVIGIVAIFILLTSAHVASWDSVTIKDFVSLLGTSIDSLPDIKGYQKEKKEVEDSSMYAHLDEIATLFRVEYKYNNKLIFTIESAPWKIVFAEDTNARYLKAKAKDGVIYKDTTANKYIVSRINLFSSKVNEGDAYVGQAFGNVRNLVKNKFLTSDKELVFAVLDKYPEITFGLDISNIPSKDPLYLKRKMIGSLKEIPDSSKIQSIVVSKYIDQNIELLKDVKLIELVSIDKGLPKSTGMDYKKTALDEKKKKLFLEDLNKLQLFSEKSKVPLGCYEIRIYGKNNEMLFFETNGYRFYDIKRKQLYISREDFLEKYWDIGRRQISPQKGLVERHRAFLEENVHCLLLQ